MNRTELQQLSQDRLLDAQSLIAASRWSGAYYLAGYAIECALKSAVLKYVDQTGIIFEDKRFELAVDIRIKFSVSVLRI